MRLTYGNLSDAQRTAWTASLIRRVQSDMRLERWFLLHSEYLPIPWYGHVRRFLAGGPAWLARVLEGWSLSVDRLADRLDYRQRLKPTARPSGQTTRFRSFKPIPTSETTGLIEPDD